ncbi:hypothetical protein FOMPIDRAFT_82779 [Fomitopsis schrenkii]|uniref:Uncharacterized protein n=1 Tax=Fomitopsis schrenkii TaxID=2126942 RepID=S8EI39_FOMSC|nr:hypothetical protein FOMPIDRAFT_82779 [Fomitopsis schrenkii]
MQPPESVPSDTLQKLRDVRADEQVSGPDSQQWLSGFLQQALRDAPSFPQALPATSPNDNGLSRAPSVNSAVTESDDMDWTPQSTPHTSPRFLGPLVPQPSDTSGISVRTYRNPPSRRLGRDMPTSSQPSTGAIAQQHTPTPTLDLNRSTSSPDDGYLPRAFDPLSAVFDLDAIVDGFPRTRYPQPLSSDEIPPFIPDATSHDQAPTNAGSTLIPTRPVDPVTHHEPAQVDDPLSWLDLETLIQATHNDDAQTHNDLDASWLTDMLLNNDVLSSTSLSNPVQISHEEASSLPETTGVLDDFVQDLQAALLEPANPAPLEESLNENYDISRSDDQRLDDPNIDLEWWRQWINEDPDEAPFSGLGPSSSSAARAGSLYNEASTPILNDWTGFTFPTV